MESASFLFDRAAPFLRRTAPLLGLLTTTALAACGDNGAGPDGDITGTWVFEDANGTTFVRITSTTITIYDDAPDCFFSIAFDIVDQDGDVYTIAFEDDPSMTVALEIERVGDNLSFEGTIFEPSNVDVSNFEICDVPGDEFDPTLFSCTSLPTLALNGSVMDSLTTGDPADPSGFRYDQYQLQLDSTTDVQLDLISGVIDPVLYLYSSSGTFIVSNDDGGDEPFASRIVETLTAGCYIVVASSWHPGETGAYELFATF